jgi:glycosyltransferase involved in cell wall biosynthesis
VLELVRAFSARPRGIKLAVLGSYEPNKVAYHAKVLAAAGPELIFLGAIYDISVVQNLRRHCLLYLHGHRVGGCNPSLLEAMGAGNPVLAHRNRFNCWVAGQGARYFLGVQDCDLMLTAMLRDPAELLSKGQINRRRAGDIFNWSDVLQSYGELLADARSGVVAGGFHWGRRPHWQLDGDVS